MPCLPGAPLLGGLLRAALKGGVLAVVSAIAIHLLRTGYKLRT